MDGEHGGGGKDDVMVDDGKDAMGKGLFAAITETLGVGPSSPGPKGDAAIKQANRQIAMMFDKLVETEEKIGKLSDTVVELNAQLEQREKQIKEKDDIINMQKRKLDRYRDLLLVMCEHKASLRSILDDLEVAESLTCRGDVTHIDAGPSIVFTRNELEKARMVPDMFAISDDEDENDYDNKQTLGGYR